MYTEIKQDTIIISRDIFEAYTRQVAEFASKTAIEEYRKAQEVENENKKKKEFLSAKEVSRIMKVSVPTVINWITRGINQGRIKLQASRKNKRDYQVTRFDLEEFRDRKQSLSV